MYKCYIKETQQSPPVNYCVANTTFSWALKKDHAIFIAA